MTLMGRVEPDGTTRPQKEKKDNRRREGEKKGGGETIHNHKSTPPAPALLCTRKTSSREMRYCMRMERFDLFESKGIILETRLREKTEARTHERIAKSSEAKWNFYCCDGFFFSRCFSFLLCSVQILLCANTRFHFLGGFFFFLFFWLENSDLVASLTKTNDKFCN